MIWETKELINSKLSENGMSDRKTTHQSIKKYIQEMHPRIAYDFLSSTYSTITATSRIAILLHHEKVDGTGYPMGLKGSEINDAAKLITICDQFDNMVMGYNGIKPIPIYQALEHLVGMSEFHFDKDIVRKFISYIAAYPTGSGVILNTNEKCLVIAQNKSMPSRPKIKVIFDKDGTKIDEYVEIDLSQSLTLFISDICEF